ncbi:hypothetical protein PVAG01_05502 [Phlyctema vagabunda]|uniref:Alpha/beta-hydrolase n=1 Tax=Phlyctema vagabunda TaxID=108571 RepID=A0ABR4PKC2_9HELO
MRMDNKAFINEKSGLLPNSPDLNVKYSNHETTATGRDRRSPVQNYLARLGLYAAILLLNCVLISKFIVGSSVWRSPNGSVFDKQLDFSEIVPSENLEWHPCFAEYGLPFQCARLTVPMDYHRPLNASKDNPKVHIALTMLPGDHSGSEKVSKSPLLINPGGPGGAGTSMLLGWGSKLHHIVGEDRDIIGFDPRGIGATTPRADCFSYPVNESSLSGHESEEVNRGYVNRALWELQGLEVGAINSSSAALKKQDMRWRTLGRMCREKDAMKGKDSILKYVHTPSVARDMLSIIDAWDEWADSLTELNLPDPELLEDTQDNEIKSLDTKGKLVYWGFSYGTLLGATFAAMFPDRVGRVILDGVVDADLYVAPVWQDSLIDADKIVTSFFEYCLQAGEKCALYRNEDKVEDIENRFKEIFARIQENPVIVIDPFEKAPVILHYEQLKAAVFSAIYFPSSTFPPLATLLDMVYRNDEKALQMGMRAPTLGTLPCGSKAPTWLYPGDAQMAIMCSDKRYPLNETIPNLEAMFEEFAHTSSFADTWMSLMVGCDGWGIEAVDPPMRWDDHPSRKQKPIKTAFPVLFLSNRHDPVTPLAAGVKMARKFVDAGLVEQESEGHCSISSTSKCTINKVREYLIDGKVPPHPVPGKEGHELADGKWDRCEADEWPWHPYADNEHVSSADDIEGKAVRDRMTVWKQMQEDAHDWLFWSRTGPSRPQPFQFDQL